MKLAHLVWIDDQYSSDIAQQDCLGDRCLCCTNAMFARMRQLYLGLGFKFTCEASRIWRDYDAAPLFMLEDLLRHRVVPYKDTGNTIRRMVERNPKADLPASSILLHIRRNYLLHESAHCVSHHILSACLIPGPSDSERFQFVLSSMACEAFATAIERIAHAFIKSPIQSLFLHLNSYVEFSLSKRELLREAIGLCGIRHIFRVAFLYLLYLNTHDGPPSEYQIQTFIALASDAVSLSLAERQIINIVCQTVFMLNAGFRDETSELCFRMINCETQFAKCSSLAFTETELLSLGIANWLDMLTNSLFTASDETNTSMVI
jgi:hypothetical protein